MILLLNFDPFRILLSVLEGYLAGLSSPQIMYHFSIEFLELAVSCLGLGEVECDLSLIHI